MLKLINFKSFKSCWENFISLLQSTKLRRLQVLNQIFDNSKSDSKKIRTNKSDRFKIQRRYPIADYKFKLILISFWLKSLDFNQFLIKRSKKTTSKVIERLKKSIKRSKKSNLIKKVNIFWLFWSLSINFALNFDLFQKCWCISELI